MGIADYSEYDGLRLAELVARDEASPAEPIKEAIECIAYRRSKPRFRQGAMMGQNHKAPGTFRFRGLKW